MSQINEANSKITSIATIYIDWMLFKPNSVCLTRI